MEEFLTDPTRPATAGQPFGACSGRVGGEESSDFRRCDEDETAERRERGGRNLHDPGGRVRQRIGFLVRQPQKPIQPHASRENARTGGADTSLYSLFRENTLSTLRQTQVFILTTP